MYRILASAGQSGERRRLAAHPAKKVPQLVATAPRQVLTWDISKLKGSNKGIWYHLYVIIDVYSRYICGWTVEAAESADRAEELIRETIERNGIVPETVHADRGTSMTSKKVSQLLIDLGVTRSQDVRGRRRLRHRRYHFNGSWTAASTSTGAVTGPRLSPTWSKTARVAASFSRSAVALSGRHRPHVRRSDTSERSPPHRPDRQRLS